jgi:hypothetical protein
MNVEPDLPEDYRCPFCPGHTDDDFVWHELAEAYICCGCRYEIDCGLDFDQQPTFDEYNCADTIEKLLKHLGISYAELQQRQKRLNTAL